MKLLDFSTGGVLTSRQLANKIVREELAMCIEAGRIIVIDFDGITHISPSFIDELFGHFINERGEEVMNQFKIINASERITKAIDFVIAHRIELLIIAGGKINNLTKQIVLIAFGPRPWLQ